MKEVGKLSRAKSMSIRYSSLIQYVTAGAKYELPKYVLSEPTNLIRDS